MSLGASPFHVAVSQAEKNLGRLTLPAPAMDAKYISWAGRYRSKDQVKLAFDSLVASPASRPDYFFVQLYWLLTAYFSSCADMGAVGFVSCQP